MAPHPSPPLSLYIHIPWCVRKCPYCDFNSHEANNRINEQRYIDALLSDLDIELELTGERPLHSIFLGGGTPSLFSPDSLFKIIDGVRQRTQCQQEIEITMEANPGTFEQEKFSLFNQAGINRLSIGIQSFNAAHLKSLGRIHDNHEALMAVEVARNAGFENINLDLMFGLPNQTIDQAINDVTTACEQNVRHISHYQLTIEPNTYFHKHPPQVPKTELLWDMQNQCHEVLSANNFSQYEVSAFSKENKQCIHNLNYWTFGDYIGIGAGAHGKLTVADKITRRWKRRQPEDYIVNTSNPLSGQSVIEGDEVIFEFLLNALRLRSGFTFEVFEKNTGFDRDLIIKACEKVDSRLLRVNETGIRTSDKGYQFLNDVLQQFI